MLQSLTIQNLATIERLALAPVAGLNALTGETGAGKSVLIEGLELALGGRASAETVRAGAKLAVAEAVFTAPLPPTAARALAELELTLEPEEPLVLRRELAATGRSRCFINEQLVGVAELKAVGEALVDFHGQHEHQSLFRPDAARGALDAFAGHDKLLARCAAAWAEAATLRRRRDALQQAALDFERRADWLDYQLEEIERLDPQPGEMAALELEEKRLAHAESLGRAAAEGYAILYEGTEEQPALLAGLREARRRVAELAAIEPAFADALARLDENEGSLADLALNLRDYRDQIEADPGRLNEVITRLEAIRRLARKHGGGEAELLAARESMRTERAQMADDDAERRRIDERLAAAEAGLARAAEALSAARRAAAGRFARTVLDFLRRLNMEKARLEVAIEPIEQPGPVGADRVDFLLAANPGLPPAPLRRIGSGGEISRVMLAIKSALAGRDGIPTLVFDEIDAGVGGEAALRVAGLLEQLGGSHQILCITHLAPIAARAAAHVSIRKSVQRGAARTEALALEGDARLEELARMMGGDGQARPARDLARQLMES